MSKAPIDIGFRVDDTPFREAMGGVITQLMLNDLLRALHVAGHNGYKAVRFVLSRRVVRDLGGEPIERIYGVPVVIDESTELGFGLVTRPPQAVR